MIGINVKSEQRNLVLSASLDVIDDDDDDDDDWINLLTNTVCPLPVLWYLYILHYIF